MFGINTRGQAKTMKHISGGSLYMHIVKVLHVCIFVNVPVVFRLGGYNWNMFDIKREWVYAWCARLTNTKVPNIISIRPKVCLGKNYKKSRVQHPGTSKSSSWHHDDSDRINKIEKGHPGCRYLKFVYGKTPDPAKFNLLIWNLQDNTPALGYTWFRRSSS